MYIIATDRKAWGKGTSDIEALFNALSHGADAKLINVMIITKIPENVDLWTSCGLNELGQLHHPKGSQVEQIMINAPEWMGKKFRDIYNDMQDLLMEDSYRVKPES